MNMPKRTIIVIEDRVKSIYNEYVCPVCKGTRTKSRSQTISTAEKMPELVFSFEDKARTRQKEQCSVCGSTDGKLLKQQTITASCCNKDVATINIYFCEACKKKYRRVIAINDPANKEKFDSIVKSLPETYRRYYEKEIKKNA